MACKILIRSSGTAYSDEVKNSVYYKGVIVSKGEVDRTIGILEQDKNNFIQVTLSDTDYPDCVNCLNCMQPKVVDDAQVALQCFYVQSEVIDTIIASGGSATMTKAEFEEKITEIA